VTRTRSPIRPPRTAGWLVELFAAPKEADGIRGDLDEEFNASVARDGVQGARRRYRRQAWRTIRDLTLSSWGTRPWSSATLVIWGLSLTTGIRSARFTWVSPIGRLVRSAAGSLLSHYPVYYYVSAPLFWNTVDLFAPLMAGILVALAARSLHVRPMSAASALALVMVVWLAVDRPIMMWLYGPPLAARVTLASSILRWVGGVLKFGCVMLAGAAIGRKLAVPAGAAELRPDTQ
jgi:hypothetical protein